MARCADMRGDARYLVLLSGAGWVRSTWESPSGCSAWRGMGALAGAGLVLFLVQAGRIAHKKRQRRSRSAAQAESTFLGEDQISPKRMCPSPCAPRGDQIAPKRMRPAQLSSDVAVGVDVDVGLDVDVSVDVDVAFLGRQLGR